MSHTPSPIVLTREQLEDTLRLMNHPETDGPHYAKLYQQILAHDAALRASHATLLVAVDKYFQGDFMTQQKLNTLKWHVHDAAMDATYQEVQS